MLRRCALTVIAALVLAGVATGCGDDDDDAAAPENPLTAAADATIAGETGQFALAATITGLEGTDGPVDVTADGSFSFPDRLVGGEADLSGLFAAISDSLDLPPFVDNLFDDPIDLVSDGQFLYLDFPLLATVSGGDDWVKVDTEVIAGGSFTIASDPSLLVRFLGGADDVVDEGEEDVDGTATTHYSGTFTLDAAVAAAPEADRERLEAAIDGLGLDADGRAEPIRFDAWVDGDDRIRVADVGFATGSAGAAQIHLEFSDFGADVEIEVPDDAVDVTDSLGGIGG